MQPKNRTPSHPGEILREEFLKLPARHLEARLPLGGGLQGPMRRRTIG